MCVREAGRARCVPFSLPRRFSLRGKFKVDAQWKLFCIVHNLLKIHRDGPGFAQRQSDRYEDIRLAVNENKQGKYRCPGSACAT